MATFLVGFFALIAGALLGYLVAGLYPTLLLKVTLKEGLDEYAERIRALECQIKELQMRGEKP